MQKNKAGEAQRRSEACFLSCICEFAVADGAGIARYVQYATRTVVTAPLAASEWRAESDCRTAFHTTYVPAHRWPQWRGASRSGPQPLLHTESPQMLLGDTEASVGVPSQSFGGLSAPAISDAPARRSPPVCRPR